MIVDIKIKIHSSFITYRRGLGVGALEEWKENRARTPLLGLDPVAFIIRVWAFGYQMYIGLRCYRHARFVLLCLYMKSPDTHINFRR